LHQVGTSPYFNLGIMPIVSRGIETRHVNLQSQTLGETDTLMHVIKIKQNVSLEKKNRLNVNLLKSYVIIAAEINETSQQMKQSDKLVHNTRIKLKPSVPQLLWYIN